MENSILLSLIIDFCKSLDDVFKKSITYKFFIKLGISFKNSILGKILIKLFVTTKDQAPHNSFFINIIDNFTNVVMKVLTYIYNYFNKIKTSSFVYNLFNSFGVFSKDFYTTSKLKNCMQGSFIYKFIVWYFNN